MTFSTLDFLAPSGGFIHVWGHVTLGLRTALLVTGSHIREQVGDTAGERAQGEEAADVPWGGPWVLRGLSDRLTPGHPGAGSAGQVGG